jgi:hypothetical protein
MIIPNPNVVLRYNPASDILLVEWPDFTDTALAEANQILDTIIETIVMYDIKCLLVDARRSIIRVTDSLYIEAIFKFAIDLERTHLKKFARVITQAMLKEQPVRNMVQKAYISVAIQNFDNIEDAWNWLTVTNTN